MTGRRRATRCRRCRRTLMPIPGWSRASATSPPMSISSARRAPPREAACACLGPGRAGRLAGRDGDRRCAPRRWPRPRRSATEEIDAARDRLIAPDQMGRSVQGDGARRARLARSRRASNERIVYRDAGPDDAAALADLGRRTFVETFGHLYPPENLAAFLASHSEARLARRARRSATSPVRLAEADGEPVAYAKLGPPSLAVRAARTGRSSFASSTCSRPWQGAGVAPGADGLGARRGARPRRRGALSVGVRRQSPRPALLRALRLRPMSAPTTSWSASHADEDHDHAARAGAV